LFFCKTTYKRTYAVSEKYKVVPFLFNNKWQHSGKILLKIGRYLNFWRKQYVPILQKSKMLFIIYAASI
ncbi:MAG: hypothetical protein NC307_08220, partial [Roseburia sp.]|nr:hypothetical protein [Roseburia sp.]